MQSVIGEKPAAQALPASGRPTGRAPHAADTKLIVTGVLRVCDVVLIVAAGVVAYLLRHGDGNIPGHYLAALGLGALLAANYLHMAGLYRFADLMQLPAQIGPLTVAWLLIGMTLIAAAYFTKTSSDFSRGWLGLWLGLTYAGFVLIRLALAWQLDQWRADGRLSTRIAVVGAGEHARRLVEHLVQAGDSGSTVVGVFDDSLARPGEAMPGAARRGTVDDLIRLARDGQIDDVVIARPWSDQTGLMATVKRLRVLPVNVKLCPEIASMPVPARGFSALAGLPMLDIFERPLPGWSLVVKAVEDRVLAFLLLVAFAPLMICVALAIRLDSPGPVLFRQRRYGFNNNEFDVFKFRSMVAGAAQDPTSAQARRGDPRITRIGAFLCRTSLDELPQLLNVLKGDMSLVGPRPHAVAHNEFYAEVIDDYLGRHRVKPGITGWAQVNGLRGETDTPEKMQARVRLDLHYIDNWSLLFDLKILVLTLIYGFVHRNAY